MPNKIIEIVCMDKFDGLGLITIDITDESEHRFYLTGTINDTLLVNEEIPVEVALLIAAQRGFDYL